MAKGILAFVVTVAAGIVADMFGSLINIQIGGIVAVAVMGAFIIYFNEKKK